MGVATDGGAPLVGVTVAAAAAMAAAAVAATAVVAAAQNKQEGPAEGPVEEGVQKGVKARVDVAQPQPGRPQLPRHRVVQERVEHIGEKERRPAGTEAAHDDGQSLSRLGLQAQAAARRLVRRWGGTGGGD